MSNGDSLDGFVFPPFIPPAATRPVDPPPAAPQASVPLPAPAAGPQSTAPARPTLPWDVETPIVGEAADLPPYAAAPADADDEEDEDLPWLERPAPRTVDEAPPAAPAQEPGAAQASDDFPDWMAWDDRDADDARADTEGVSAVEGLEDFVPADDLGSHFSPAPAVDWTEAEPVADAATGLGAADAPVMEAPADFSAWSLDATDALVTEDPADSSVWSLDAPEGAEPPPLPFDGGGSSALTFDEAQVAEAPAVTGLAPETFGSEESGIASEQPDPFTAASVSGAEQAAPVSAAGPFAEVAAQLEDIARTLRERPDELLGGNASDPLALLVAGYVMGYRARGGH